MEPRFRRLPLGEGMSGFLFAVSLILSTLFLTSLILSAARWLDPVLGQLTEIVFIYYAISSRSLAHAAEGVARCLESEGLHKARARVGMIVGRDTARLSETGVIRGVVETVAENLVDGVTAPIFFAAIGGAPLAMAYKMINTLDSMIGYKNARYRRFGATAARIDDAANFIPSRLSVPIIALAAQILDKKGKRSFETAVAEGADHSSPNAGLAEAAFAGALGVKLNGPNYYHGRMVEKPYIGKRFGEAVIEHIPRACDLMLLSSVLWVALATAALMVFDWPL